jgi:putative transposase
MGQTYLRKETYVFLIHDHIVFCPKRRRKILVGPIRDRLMGILRETAPELECDVLALEVMPDHAPIVLSATPQWALNQLIARLKGKSARLLRHEFPALQRMPSVWTRSDFVSTAGHVSSQTIARSIAEHPARD